MCVLCDLQAKERFIGVGEGGLTSPTEVREGVEVWWGLEGGEPEGGVGEVGWERAVGCSSR